MSHPKKLREETDWSVGAVRLPGKPLKSASLAGKRHLALGHCLASSWGGRASGREKYVTLVHTLGWILKELKLEAITYTLPELSNTS